MVVKVLKYIASLVYTVFTSILIIMLLCNKISGIGIALSVAYVCVLTYSFFSNKHKIYVVMQFILPAILGIIGLILICTLESKIIDTSGMFGGLASLAAFVEAVAGAVIAGIGLIAYIIYRIAINHAAKKADNKEEVEKKINKVTAVLAIIVILLPFIIAGINYLSDKKAARDYEKEMEEFHERQLYKDGFYETNGYGADNRIDGWDDHIEFEYYWSIFDKYLETMKDTKDLELVYEWRDNEEDNFYNHIPVFVKDTEHDAYEYKIAVKGWYWWNGTEYYNSQGYLIYRSPLDIESYYDLSASNMHIAECSLEDIED